MFVWELAGWPDAIETCGGWDIWSLDSMLPAHYLFVSGEENGASWGKGEEVAMDVLGTPI